ncbi:MAG: hypothetical protein CND26_05070 [Bacteroidetes bacterium MED-G13]|nr:MAG: hypothetical protein CND26_05070 [Bacteroidetes bacterium MED-G13]|tara:strand:- start:9139 stop:9747 length:609 start_codon:yes stop_codon:yes gene_type:complete
MSLVIHPTYFPNILFFSKILNHNRIFFEINDNYIKQSLRNRTLIYHANGVLKLSVPVKYSSKKKRKFKDIEICNDTNWQKKHFKSIKFAYQSSPYFEFYENSFEKLFKKKEKFLIDINLKSIALLFELIDRKLEYTFTEKYYEIYNGYTNSREISNFNFSDKSLSFKKYTQVFETKFGFKENLSMLDLLFNYGPNYYNFLVK